MLNFVLTTHNTLRSRCVLLTLFGLDLGPERRIVGEEAVKQALDAWLVNEASVFTHSFRCPSHNWDRRGGHMEAEVRWRVRHAMVLALGTVCQPIIRVLLHELPQLVVFLPPTPLIAQLLNRL